MATVYLATDLRHQRSVALKVLDPELAKSIGPDRFLREIRTTAQLVHPNILPLLDSGGAGGTLFYVMPYVDGESLRDRLVREKQLPVDDALRIGREVEDALDYAHAHGVIHRDIKPENILLEAGHAVVADFGVARAVDRAGGGRQTEPGIAIGTPAYMSPEQASGSTDLDGRSDLYSLGCVLYEMLAGQPPFTGPTNESLVQQHLTAVPPNVTVMRPSVPEWVATAINRSLAKTPADRMLRLELGGAAPEREFWRSWRRLAVLATSLLAVVLLVLAANRLRSRTRARSETPASIVLAMPLAQPVADAPDLTFDLSPDGRTFVYVGQSEDGQQLFRQGVNGLEARPVAGTVGARAPVFSPDGRWLAFLAKGRVQRVPIEGGVPAVVTSAPGAVQGLAWADNGTIIFALTTASGLVAVPREGGPAVALTRPDSARGVYSHRWPQALPGGSGVLFTAWTGRAETARIAVLSLRTSRTVYLMPGVTARYLASGHLVCGTSDGRLELWDFDSKTLRLGSEPRVIAQGVRTSPAANFAVSREGTLVYMTRETAERRVVIVDRDGHQDAVVPLTGDVSDPRFSPDGTRLAFTKRTDGLAGVWTFDLGRGLLSPLTSNSENLYPLWTPTGDRIAFSSSRGGTIDLQWIGLAEGSEGQTLLGGPGDKVPESWSPDGRELVFRTTSPGTGRDIWRLPLGEAAVPVAVQATPADERSSALAPNGRLLAYVSDESGRDEVYVRSFPSGTSRWQVSTTGGSEPAWSRDGSELFYRSGRGVYSARVTTRQFAVTSRTLLFEGTFMANPFRTNYDVHPDGRRFVFITSGQARVEVVVLLMGIRR